MLFPSFRLFTDRNRTGTTGETEVIRVYRDDTLDLSCIVIVVSVLDCSKCVVDLVTVIVLGFMVSCMSTLNFGLDD